MAQDINQLSGALSASVRSAQGGVVRVETDRGTHISGCAYAPRLVLTSNAELGRGEPVRVGTEDGANIEAELVGRDPGYDLALLRVASDLQPLEFVAAGSLTVGQLALALGRPGRAIRASLRVIGLLSDDVETTHGTVLSRYIETDRGFPPGFGGGPLIDLEGRALGLNTPRLVRGADLTLPLPEIERSVALLLEHGSIPRGYLGIAAQPVRLPRELRQRLGRRSGAMVLGVQSGSPAQRAGILFGDTLITLDGKPVTGPRDVAARLRERAGAEIAVELIRASELKQLSLTAQARSPAPPPEPGQDP